MTTRSPSCFVTSWRGLLRRPSPPDTDIFVCVRPWFEVLAGRSRGRYCRLPAARREWAFRAILELPDRVGILSWKVVAPVMANQLDGAGRGLNLLSREALGAAVVLNAKVVMAPGNENRLLREAPRQVGLL